MSENRLMLGVDMGGTKLWAGLASLGGEIIRWQALPTEAEMGPEVVLPRLFFLIRQILSSEGKAPAQVSGIGIACAGLIDMERGLVVTSPNLPGWTDFPLKDRVEGELGVSTFLMNDANASALGEYAYGAGRGVKDLVYVTVSTGIGGGLVLGGQLYTGFMGTAGEVGHMTIKADGPGCACGNRGCWEALASGSAIAREARARLTHLAREETITAEMVSQLAQQGDEGARKIIHKAAIYFGVGLANLVNIFNPEVVVIGGGVAKIGEMFLEPAEAEMRKRAFAFPVGRVRLRLSQLGDRAALYGLIAWLEK